jgi:hypothetical protein
MSGIAHMPVRQHGTAMRTAIEQNVKGTVITAHQDHWLAANLEGCKIAFVFYLAFVACVNPAFIKDMFYFLLEDFFTCVTGFMNPVGID